MRPHVLVLTVLVALLGLALAGCTRGSRHSDDIVHGAERATRPPPQPAAGAAQDVLVVNAGGALLSVRGDGTGVRRLVSGGGLAGFCLSPDRRSVAFADAVGLAIRDLASGATDRVPQTEGAAYPRWSAQGSLLAFRSDVRGGIWVADVRAPRPRKVSDTADLRYLGVCAWSPDGSRLAIAGDADGRRRIYVADLTQGSLKPVTSGLGDDDSPTWAPGGHELGFCRSTPRGQPPRPGPGGVFVVAVDGGAERRVSPRPATHVAWSPDGRSIALAAGALYIADPAGDHEVQITQPAEQGGVSVSDFAPAWSRDSRRIYFLRLDTGMPGDELPMVRCLGLYCAPSGGGPARLVLREDGIHEFDV